MFRVLFGIVVGALIAVLVIGYVTGPPKLPGKDWVKKFWSPPGHHKARVSSTLWRSEPKVANGRIEVTAWGAASMEESKNRSHAVSLALRTARHLAYEQLAEFLQGARTNGQSHYHEDALQRASLTTTTNAVIRNARIVREEVSEMPDGSIRAAVTLRHSLPKKAGF